MKMEIKCRKCPQVFKQHKDLKKHIDIVHVKAIRCSYKGCSKLVKPIHMKVHMKNIHQVKTPEAEQNPNNKVGIQKLNGNIPSHSQRKRDNFPEGQDSELQILTYCRCTYENCFGLFPEQYLEEHKKLHEIISQRKLISEENEQGTKRPEVQSEKCPQAITKPKIQCPYCRIIFSSLASLKVHLSKFHLKPAGLSKTHFNVSSQSIPVSTKSRSRLSLPSRTISVPMESPSKIYYKCPVPGCKSHCNTEKGLKLHQQKRHTKNVLDSEDNSPKPLKQSPRLNKIVNTEEIVQQNLKPPIQKQNTGEIQKPNVIERVTRQNGLIYGTRMMEPVIVIRSGETVEKKFTNASQEEHELISKNCEAPKSKNCRIKCNYLECKQIFNSVDELSRHVSEFHESCNESLVLTKPEMEQSIHNIESCDISNDYEQNENIDSTQYSDNNDSMMDIEIDVET